MYLNCYIFFLWKNIYLIYGNKHSKKTSRTSLRAYGCPGDIFDAKARGKLGMGRKEGEGEKDFLLSIPSPLPLHFGAAVHPTTPLSLSLKKKVKRSVYWGSKWRDKRLQECHGRGKSLGTRLKECSRNSSNERSHWIKDNISNNN